MNSRQAKKKMKYNILHMKPNEVVIIKFPINGFISVEELNDMFKYFKEIVPKENGFCFMPNDFAIKELTKEEAYNCLDKFKDLVYEIFGERDN